MRFDGALHDREPEARATHACRGKRLEQPIPDTTTVWSGASFMPAMLL